MSNDMANNGLRPAPSFDGALKIATA